MKRESDFLVLGLGVMGSAVTYQLAKKKQSVLGIDQHTPPHAVGSSHGNARMIRRAMGEGEEYAPIISRAYELWHDIAKETDTELLVTTGGLIISKINTESANYSTKFLHDTIAHAERHGIRHEVLTKSNIRKRFPQFCVAEDEMGYYEYDAGSLRADACVSAQLKLAKKHGAALMLNEKVTQFYSDGEVIHLFTNSSQYTARHLILCAGPWIASLLGKDYKNLFEVRRQVTFAFKTKDGGEKFRYPQFPVFIWEPQGQTKGIYGFPILDKTFSVQIASDEFDVPAVPGDPSQQVSHAEMQTIYRQCIERYIPGLSNACIQANACVYTVTPDYQFIIDTHPEYPNVTIVSPCSGHGFKHSAAIGEMVAELVTEGKSSIDMSSFSLGRFKHYARNSL